MAVKHAVLSASSSERWLNCPPSARLCEAYEDKGSDYAAEGTDAHSLCEFRLKQALGIPADDPIENLSWYNEEMADRIAGALVDAAYRKEENPRIAVEVLLGHGVCHIIAETSVSIPQDEVASIVHRIAEGGRQAGAAGGHQGAGTEVCGLIIYEVGGIRFSPARSFCSPVFNTFAAFFKASGRVDRLAIRLYFLSLYNGGIDAQNTHFQSNKSLNELHFLKYSSIFSFWAKIKDRQFYNQRSNRSMELKSSFFPSEMILSFFSLYNANDNIIFRRETLSPTEMFNSYQKWFRKICFPQPCHSSSTHFSFIS